MVWRVMKIKLVVKMSMQPCCFSMMDLPIEEIKNFRP